MPTGAVACGRGRQCQGAAKLRTFVAPAPDAARSSSALLALSLLFSPQIIVDIATYRYHLFTALTVDYLRTLAKGEQPVRVRNLYGECALYARRLSDETRWRKTRELISGLQVVRPWTPKSLNRRDDRSKTKMRRMMAVVVPDWIRTPAVRQLLPRRVQKHQCY
jgi:hypothetical protein